MCPAALPSTNCCFHCRRAVSAPVSRQQRPSQILGLRHLGGHCTSRYLCLAYINHYHRCVPCQHHVATCTQPVTVRSSSCFPAFAAFAVITNGFFGWGGDAATTETVVEATDLPSASDLSVATPPGIDTQPLVGSYSNAEPPQSLIDEQLAHMIQPDMDDFEEVRSLNCFCFVLFFIKGPIQGNFD